MTEPKPLPMKAIGITFLTLFVALAIVFLVLPAFFDVSIVTKLFHNEAPPWAVSDEENKLTALTSVQLQGKEIFLQNCASCHGPTGKGNGPTSVALRKRVPNFILPGTQFVNGLTHEGIEKTLIQGIPGSEMPSFSQMREEDREKIKTYIIYLKDNASLL